MSHDKPFYNQLKQVCEFVAETKSKTDYVLDLYYQRDVSILLKCLYKP